MHIGDFENQQKLDLAYAFICRSDEKPPIEIQADKFAAALLMPDQLLKEYIKGRDLCSWPALYKLKDELHVSLAALRNRLEKLNLLYFDEKSKKFYSSKAQTNGQMSLF